jgi:hypothetical protein
MRRGSKEKDEQGSFQVEKPNPRVFKRYFAESLRRELKSLGQNFEKDGILRFMRVVKIFAVCA